MDTLRHGYRVWGCACLLAVGAHTSAWASGQTDTQATTPLHLTQAVSAQPRTVPSGQTDTERCLLAAARYHGVNPKILRAILQIESAMRPHVVKRNANGTVDVGMAQINSIHFAELAKWGITPQKLLDPCIATHVAAWHLKRVVLRHGDTWFGVAAYHSVTPSLNARYQALLRQELQRQNRLR